MEGSLANLVSESESKLRSFLYLTTCELVSLTRRAGSISENSLSKDSVGFKLRISGSDESFFLADPRYGKAFGFLAMNTLLSSFICLCLCDRFEINDIYRLEGTRGCSTIYLFAIGSWK